MAELGPIQFSITGLREEGRLHCFALEVTNSSNEKLFLDLTRANGFQQYERCEIPPAAFKHAAEFPVRLFGSAWQQETMSLELTVLKKDETYNCEQAEYDYYHDPDFDPDVPPPPPVRYVPVAAKTFRVHLR